MTSFEMVPGMEKPLSLICSPPAPARATCRFLVVCRLLVLLPVLFSMETCEGGTPDESSSNDVPAKKKNVGTEKRLTFDGHLKHDPVFVDSGKAIVYTSLEKFNQLCLMKVGFPVNGETEPVRFHGAASTSELMATFSKDDRVYAYLRNNGNLHFEIVLEDRGAGKSVSYNPGGGFAGVRNISYAPDGTNVIFAFPNQNGPQQILLHCKIC